MDKQQIDVSALYGFEAGLRENAGELERARDTAVALEGRVAELEAALAATKHTWTERDAANLARIRLEDDLRHAQRGLAAKQQVIEEAALAWERENAARENAEVSLRRAEGQEATLRAALSNLYEDAASAEFHLNCECDEVQQCPKHALSESSLPKAEAALTGTGDFELAEQTGCNWKESAVFSGSVERLIADVADLLAKQPVWEVKRDG